MVRVGVVGCGAIGTALATTLTREFPLQARIAFLHDQVRSSAHALQQRLRPRPTIVSLPELIRRSDLVIEAASVRIAGRIARLALASHRQALIMSTGGLLLDPSWRTAAARSRGRLILPSGGVCGLDGLKALLASGLRRVRLTTRKPPRSLAMAPFVQRRGLMLNRLTRPRVIFEGSPRDAIYGFPQNTNVAATIALAVRAARPASRGRVTMRVVADPTTTRNVHEVEAEGRRGRVVCRLESDPSPRNPKTSELAIQSAIVALRQLFEPVRIGT